MTVKGGLNGGIKSMGDRKKEANGVLGMVKSGIRDWVKIRMVDTVQTYINKFGLNELVNLICLGDVSVNGVDKLGISVNENT